MKLIFHCVPCLARQHVIIWH